MNSLVRDEAERRSWRTSRQAWRAAGVRVGEEEVAECVGSSIADREVSADGRRCQDDAAAAVADYDCELYFESVKFELGRKA